MGLASSSFLILWTIFFLKLNKTKAVNLIKQHYVIGTISCMILITPIFVALSFGKKVYYFKNEFENQNYFESQGVFAEFKTNLHIYKFKIGKKYFQVSSKSSPCLDVGIFRNLKEGDLITVKWSKKEKDFCIMEITNHSL